MTDSEQFDKEAVRGTILAMATEWMTAEDIQREVNAGGSAAHVPIQIVQQVLDDMLTRSEVESRTLAIGDYATTYKVRRALIVERRAKVLERLAFEDHNASFEASLLTKSGGYPADVHDLIAAGLLTRKKSDIGELIVLLDSAAAQIVAAGSRAVVESLIPLPDGETMQVSDTTDEFSRKAVEQLDIERERRIRAEAERGRLIEWLRDKGITEIDGILGPPAVQPARNTFEWTQRRTIDEAEKGRILMEVLDLEQSVALVQVRFEGQKSAYKAEIERLNAAIAALKGAAMGSERVTSCEAYKEIDWDEKVVIVRAVSDDRELERQPIPKGTQKSLLDKAVGEAGDAEASKPKPPMPALRQAILEALSDKGAPMTLSEISDAITARYEVPEGLVGALRLELAAMIKAAAIVHKGGKRFALPPISADANEASAAEEPEAKADDDEPGPLASPKRRSRKRAAEATAEA